MVQVFIEPFGVGSVICRPSGFLGKEVFARYLAATRSAGARFEKEAKAQVAPMTAIVALTDSLRRADFEPVLAGEIAATMRARAAGMRADISSAEARLTTISEMLAKRGISPYPFQVEGIRWVAPRADVLLGDDPGLGKTMQFLLAAPEKAPILVVCPSIAKGIITKSGMPLGGWAGESVKFRNDLTPIVVDEKTAFRWPAPGEIVITNYERLPDLNGDANSIADFPLGPGRGCYPGTVIIADEVHYLKNPKTKRTIRFRSIAGNVHAAGGRRWAASGTPLLNLRKDIWHVLASVGLAEAAFGSWPTFCRVIGAEPNMVWERDPEGGAPRQVHKGWIWDARDPSPEAADMLKRVMLKRIREEVLPDLPEKQFSTVAVALDEKMKAKCDDFISLLKTEGIDFEEEISLATLTKIASLGLAEYSETRKALAIAKIPALVEIVEQYEEAGLPLVVFSAHRDPALLLGKREGWGRLVGGDSNTIRKQVEADFQDGKLKGVACVIAAAGVAINLSRAGHAVFVDRDWSPEVNRQAEDRLPRPGSTHDSVLIIDMVADHDLDRRVNEILMEKKGTIACVITAAKHDGGPTLNPAVEMETLADEFQAGSASLAVDGRRPAATNLERAAANTLLEVDMLCDIGKGFEAGDVDAGRRLAARLSKYGGLTPREWALTISIARRYS